MPFLRFIGILAFGTILSWAAWVLTLLRLNPYQDGTVAVILFLGSGAFALGGTLTIGGFFIRYWLEKQTVIYRQFSVAARQGILITGCALVCAVLQLGGLLHWWSMMMIVIMTTLIELFFQAGQYRRVSPPSDAVSS